MRQREKQRDREGIEAQHEKDDRKRFALGHSAPPFTFR
jgi:hypothetical protein